MLNATHPPKKKEPKKKKKMQKIQNLNVHNSLYNFGRDPS